MPALATLALLVALGSDTDTAEAPVVRSVRLEADARAQARLRRYVLVAEGRPLEPAQVAESVRLLFATGEFEDVAVLTEPARDGLALVFRPSPAPRMTGFAVRGDRVVSEKELRRATRLRWNEPLWEARLEEAGRDAALALAERGYLEGRVTVHAERGSAGATAVCEVAAGPLVRVDSVGVEGAPPEARAVLEARARPRVGDAWRRARADNAAEAMRLELRGRGRWRAAVAVHEAYDPRTARVQLRFEVSAGPRTSVSLRGPRVPAELRRLAERVVREGGAEEDALEDALDRIEEGLRMRGYRNAVVTRREETGPDRLEIVYELDAGEQAQVASVRIAGVEPAELSGVALTTRAGEALREDQLDADVAALTQALLERGYSQARVEAEAGDGGGLVPVAFIARPGIRTLVAAVRVQGELAAAGVKSPVLLTRPGQPYRVRSVALDRSALVAAWREAGFLQADLEPVIELSDDKRAATIVLRLTPGPRTVVGPIVVAGLQRTREEVVRRELGFGTGDPFSLTRILDAQRRLQGLGIFERVSAREILGETDASRPVVVALEEAARAAVSYGLGYAERDLLRGSVEVTLRDLYGLDRSLSSFARISFRGSRLLATYREPRLFGKKQELFVTGFREEQDQDNFDYIRYGGQAQTARPLAGRLSLITRLTYQRTEVFNVTVPLAEIDRQFRTSTFAGPSASLVFDTRNDPLDPVRGQFVGADFALSHGVLGGDSFAKGFLQSSSYAPLAPRLVLAVALRLGLAGTFRGEPPRLPLPDRFFAGGDYSLRGFSIDGVNPEGGNALLLGSAELRFAARPRFELALFSDVGNVYPLASELSLHGLRYTAGLGLRYKSSIGPLRLDWGYKLDRRPGENPYQIHVTVGHAF